MVTVIAAQQIYNTLRKLQGMTNNVGLTFNAGDTIYSFTLGIE